MKTLLVLRHAKAQKDAPNGDKARVLTERGKRNAATMGHLLPQIAPVLDRVVASDAKRAQQTATIVATGAGFVGDITTQPAIYGADLDEMVDLVHHLPNGDDCVLLVGHNPVFEELAAALAEPGTPPPSLPTAGLAHLEFDVQRWRDVREGKGKLRGVHRP